MESEVELRQKRTLGRGKATRLLKELLECDKTDEDELALAIHHLDEHIQYMAQIQLHLEKLSVFDDSSHMQDMRDQVFKAKRVLARLERGSEAKAVAGGGNACSGRKFQLDLKLPKFNGDLETWQEFWNLFKVSVHENHVYTPVEKCVHLKAYLVGQAEVAVHGLPFTEQGYQKAVDTLKERFDRPDLRRQVLIQRLLNTTPVHNDSDLVRLRRMVDGLVSEVRALETMEVQSDSYSVLLMPVLMSCIPESWKIEWLRLRFKPAPGASDELTTFLKFLQREMGIREEAAARKKVVLEGQSAPSPGKSTVSVLDVRQKRRSPDWVCSACGMGKHGLSACSAYRRMTVPARLTVVKRAGLCYQCLGPHLLRACTSTQCPWCGGPHHSSLHPPPEGGVANAGPQGRHAPFTDRRPLPPPGALHAASDTSHAASTPAITAQRDPAHATSLSRGVPPPPSAVGPDKGKLCFNLSAQNRCYVQTALVNAVGPRGVRPTRLLIDGGSDTSFIRASLAEELGLETVGQGTFACIGFKEKLEETRQYHQVNVKLAGLQTGEAVLTFWKTEKLCVPVGGSAPEVMSLPPSVQLADDHREGPVDLLIGCDQLYKVVLWNQMEVSPGLRLIETIFGYVLHGQAQGEKPTTQRHAYRCHLADAERMWDLDSLGISAKVTCESLPEPTWNSEEQR